MRREEKRLTTAEFRAKCQNFHAHMHGFKFKNKLLFIICILLKPMASSEHSVDRHWRHIGNYSQPKDRDRERGDRGESRTEK